MFKDFFGPIACCFCDHPLKILIKVDQMIIIFLSDIKIGITHTKEGDILAPMPMPMPITWLSKPNVKAYTGTKPQQTDE